MVDTVLEYTAYRGDGVVEPVTVRRTDDPAYPSGWRYSLHYGTVDGRTLLRYDNAHERTKGHERHVGDDANDRERIEFPGMDALPGEFYDEIDELQP